MLTGIIAGVALAAIGITWRSVKRRLWVEREWVKVHRAQTESARNMAIALEAENAALVVIMGMVRDLANDCKPDQRLNDAIYEALDEALGQLKP